jgi:1-acyl-sn-glycerol-3-phosphate acyltransferase
LLQPFKNGAFTLAIETQQPIVPMVMFNTKKCMPRVPKFALWPGIIDIHFLPSMETKGMVKSDLETLKREVFEQMENKLLELQGKPVALATH